MTMTTTSCTIDETILNAKSLPHMKDIALSFFASACGKNRGAFVVDPPDGHTYGCLIMPSNIVELAGLTDGDSEKKHSHLESLTFDTSNDIPTQYAVGNITETETIQLLDFLVKSIFESTPDKDTNPYACEFNGLARLACEDQGPGLQVNGAPIRSVTLAGLFVDALWATGGNSLSMEQRLNWYSSQDFKAMSSMGLNTVQIPVPTTAFVAGNTQGKQVLSHLKATLDQASAAGLSAILVLVGNDDDLDAVVGASRFAISYNEKGSSSSILALTLPAQSSLDMRSIVAAIRVEAPTLPLFVPMNLGNLIMSMVESNPESFGDNVYISLDMTHTATVADIASSVSQEDRSKLFYHEALSCMARSPLEFANCVVKVPAFVSSGFDLSIDDCAFQYDELTFRNYGQCDRFNETIDSDWWLRHRSSFAARQLYAYEQGLGWSFAAWKLYGSTYTDGRLDSPAKLLSLSDVWEAGLFPTLTDSKVETLNPCLNPPVNDFVLGDDTLAPTMGPPPDCGYGWWNYTTEKCDYWVPPPEPTPAPTEPCPVCESKCTGMETQAALMGSGQDINLDAAIHSPPLMLATLLGAVAGAFFMWFVMSRKDRRRNYELIQ
eukprot:Nitzschia sp. Nitz4//scaffold108_size72880//29414//31332//NITZ4_005813-RA/size72880-augustus-gene-0.27-mRNA-1//1//CDS//3329532663//8832//frame0